MNGGSTNELVNEWGINEWGDFEIWWMRGRWLGGRWMGGRRIEVVPCFFREIFSIWKWLFDMKILFSGEFARHEDFVTREICLTWRCFFQGNLLDKERFFRAKFAWHEVVFPQFVVEDVFFQRYLLDKEIFFQRNLLDTKMFFCRNLLRHKDVLEGNLLDKAMIFFREICSTRRRPRGWRQRSALSWAFA
jgi:hypothetical protein